MGDRLGATAAGPSGCQIRTGSGARFGGLIGAEPAGGLSVGDCAGAGVPGLAGAPDGLEAPDLGGVTDFVGVAGWEGGGAEGVAGSTAALGAGALPDGADGSLGDELPFDGV